MQEVMRQIAEGIRGRPDYFTLEDISVLADIDETCCGIIKEGWVVFITPT